MTPGTFLALALRPACALLGPRFVDPRAEVLLLAICLQESGLQYRRQLHGPARGFAQFELIGVEDVLTRATSAAAAQALLAELAYPLWSPAPVVHAAIEHNDLLACGIARLALFNLPQPLPTVGAAEAGWAQYLAVWRPGKPRPTAWAGHYARAVETVRGSR